MASEQMTCGNLGVDGVRLALVPAGGAVWPDDLGDDTLVLCLGDEGFPCVHCNPLDGRLR